MASAWREAFPMLHTTLLLGNHDLSAGGAPPFFGLDEVTQSLQIGPVRLQHFPEPDPDTYIIGGHIHPGVLIPDPIAGGHRLPAFVFSKEVGIVPAFGSFTGLAIQKRTKGLRFFPVAEGQVFRL